MCPDGLARAPTRTRGLSRLTKGSRLIWSCDVRTGGGRYFRLDAAFTRPLDRAPERARRPEGMSLRRGHLGHQDESDHGASPYGPPLLIARGSLAAGRPARRRLQLTKVVAVAPAPMVCRSLRAEQLNLGLLTLPFRRGSREALSKTRAGCG